MKNTASNIINKKINIVNEGIVYSVKGDLVRTIDY